MGLINQPMGFHRPRHQDNHSNTPWTLHELGSQWNGIRCNDTALDLITKGVVSSIFTVKLIVLLYSSFLLSYSKLMNVLRNRKQKLEPYLCSPLHAACLPACLPFIYANLFNLIQCGRAHTSIRSMLNVIDWPARLSRALPSLTGQAFPLHVHKIMSVEQSNFVPLFWIVRRFMVHMSYVSIYNLT